MLRSPSRPLAKSINNKAMQDNSTNNQGGQRVLPVLLRLLRRSTQHKNLSAVSSKGDNNGQNVQGARSDPFSRDSFGQSLLRGLSSQMAAMAAADGARVHMSPDAHVRRGSTCAATLRS